MLRPDRGLRCKAFISVGHDEYWDIRQFRSVERMRDAGVCLLFLSGNAICWVTPFRPGGDGRPNRLISRGGPFGGENVRPALEEHAGRLPHRRRPARHELRVVGAQAQPAPRQPQPPRHGPRHQQPGHRLQPGSGDVEARPDAPGREVSGLPLLSAHLPDGLEHARGRRQVPGQGAIRHRWLEAATLLAHVAVVVGPLLYFLGPWSTLLILVLWKAAGGSTSPPCSPPTTKACCRWMRTPTSISSGARSSPPETSGPVL